MRRAGILALGVAGAFGLLAAGAQAAPVAGDFDGDGNADLAVDVEGQTVSGHPGAGAVQVIYGSHHGLSGARDRIFTEDTPKVRQAAGDSDAWGLALATGHFNGDRFADLAIGSPLKDTGGASDAGSVQILYGSKRGLRPRGSRLLIEGRHGLPGSVSAGDQFGISLAAANLGRSGEDDLAIGSSAAVGGNSGAGAVDVVYGSRRGLRPKHSKRFTQDTPGVKDHAESGDGLGFALAAADFGRDSHADLAIGALHESAGAVANAGAVNVLYGSRRGLRARRSQFFSQDTPGVPDAAESGDTFGWSLGAADLGRSRRADLAIGAPAETVGAASYAGAVNVLYGSRAGLRAKGSQFITQDSLGGIGEGSEFEDEFGVSLAAADFGRGKPADLAIGVPYECVGSSPCVTSAGEVNVVYGSSHGLANSGSGAQLVAQGPPFKDAPEQYDTFGWAVAAGRFRGTRVNDLAAGAPIEDVVNPDDHAGAVMVVRGSASGITPSHDQFLTQGSGALEGSPEQNDLFGNELSGTKSTVPYD